MIDRTDDLVTAHREDIHAPPSATVQRWHDALDAAAAEERANRRPQRTTLALGIAIGVFIGGDETVSYEPVGTVATSGNVLPDALSRGLQVHFRDSRAQIVNLSDADDRTTLVLRIIEQNRMFENAATISDAPKLARVLRAFEPILLQLAADNLAPADAQALQAQLAFELNVMLTKLSAESSNDSHTT